MKNNHAEPTFTDPVCGMKLSRKTAAEELVCGGTAYYFCARVCREAFEKDPQKYILPHRQHGVRPT